MWHPAAPCAGRVAGCTPTARGSPSHAFPGMCCGCTHVPTSPAMPEICLPLAGCSPKAREPVPELAAACWSCQDSFPQDCPCQAPWWGLKISPWLGKPPAWLQGGSRLCWPCAGTCPAPGSTRLLGWTGFWGHWWYRAVPIKCCSSVCEQGIPLAIWRGLVAGSTSEGEVFGWPEIVWARDAHVEGFKTFSSSSLCVWVLQRVSLHSEHLRGVLPFSAVGQARKAAGKADCRLCHRWRCSCILFWADCAMKL